MDLNRIGAISKQKLYSSVFVSVNEYKNFHTGFCNTATSCVYKWFYNGKIHRYGNNPSIIMLEQKSKIWYRHGYRHREDDLPSLIIDGNLKQWFYDGVNHRDNDKPSLVITDGYKEWWSHGKRKRGGYKPVVAF
jgi:hypothetical protein